MRSCSSRSVDELDAQSIPCFIDLGDTWRFGEGPSFVSSPRRHDEAFALEPARAALLLSSCCQVLLSSLIQVRLMTIRARSNDSVQRDRRFDSIGGSRERRSGPSRLSTWTARQLLLA